MNDDLLISSAQQYAGFWKRRESVFVADLASSDHGRRLRALQRAAGYFRISRNFPLRFDTERGLDRLQPALAVLDEYGVEPRGGMLRHIVDTLRRKLAEAYGRKDALSAATKFLWLLHRNPVIIFDSQARAALGTPPGDYPAFLIRWSEEYAANVDRLVAACTVASIDAPSDEVWFQWRVFDIALWNLGRPRRTVAHN